MKISDFIKRLQEQQDKHGDLEVCTWDGRVRAVRFGVCRDGISTERERKGVTPRRGETPNEVVLEFDTTYEK